MPELPEVETIRRDLSRFVLGQSITRVEIRLPKTVKSPADQFLAALQGNQFSTIDRVGKLLIFRLEHGEDSVLVHLRMTGQLIYQDQANLVTGGHPFPAFNTPLPNKFTHLIWHFSETSALYFNDQRQFGFAKLATPTEVLAAQQQFGIEPLTPAFTLAEFQQRLARRSAPIKAVLLDQTTIAGLGNIYADEVCWQAPVHPLQPANSLTTVQTKLLWQACQDILADAITHRGTTFRDFRDGEGQAGGYAPLLKVYGKAGQPCPRCQTPIMKIRAAGRGTHLCPQCQVLTQQTT
jgi:formamidopyrimidine-DNA glycosylase